MSLARHRGYNPNKRGRKSFHPLLAFVGETRDFLLGKLRPGDVHTANGAVEFLEQCFAQIGLERLHKLVLRADSGFCSRRKAEELIEAGRVKINGHPAKLGDKAFAKDVVTIDDERLAVKKKKKYIYCNIF